MDHKMFLKIYFLFILFSPFTVGEIIDQSPSKRKYIRKLTYIKNAQVIYPALVDVDNYALATVPRETIYIANSSLPNAGLGAFAARRIPNDSYIGPYDGPKYTAFPANKPKNYAWQIPDKSGKMINYVDASEPNRSNWLRYINCPNTASQRNLVSFIFRANIYYLAIRDIEIGEELLVYYGKDYAEELGIDPIQFN